MYDVQLIKVSVRINICPRRQVLVYFLRLGQDWVLIASETDRTTLELDCFGLHLIAAFTSASRTAC